jgi:hypothetical protein
LLVVVLVAAVAFRAAASDVSDTVGDPQGYLGDLVDNRDEAAASVWLMGAASLLLAVAFAGLYFGLRRRGEDAMRVALAAGLIAAVLNVSRVAAQAAIVAHIVPEWAVDPNPLRRAVLQANFKTIEWFSIATESALQVSLSVAMTAAGLVMIRMGRRWWWPALVGFAGAIAGLVGAFRPAEAGLRDATLVQVAALALWSLLLSIRLQLTGGEGESESGAD